jgi:UDP-2,3-diacylglucosamine pyrophosphatase LpxH
VLQKLLRKARKGTRIVFIPGNHDEGVRGYCGMSFGAIEIHHDAVHVTADGRRFLVMHGDEFDVIVRYAKWLAFLGDRSYEFALWCNRPLNRVRRWFGFGYWSLSGYLKLRVKTAVNFIGEFEHAIAAEARRRNVDGVICGHIHHMADRMIGGIRYVNCGDWVESCTAIAEDYDGQLHQIHWPRNPAEAVQTASHGAPVPAFAAEGALARAPVIASDWPAGANQLANAAARMHKDIASVE